MRYADAHGFRLGFEVLQSTDLSGRNGFPGCFIGNTGKWSDHRFACGRRAIEIKGAKRRLPSAHFWYSIFVCGRVRAPESDPR